MTTASKSPSLISGEIALSPAGKLNFNYADGEFGQSGAWSKAVKSAFASNQCAGIFAMAANQPREALSPVESYWREFASLYLSQLCQSPEASSGAGKCEIAAPDSAIESLLLSAPPMRGAEYLSKDLLLNLWAELDQWVQEQASQSESGLGAWLKLNAPLWHQVGRVCFHLAENKLDEAYPFAFLATYAHSVSRSGKVQYQPLGQALKEYAGEHNKKALINLLTPVQLAAEGSELVSELLESNDIFHPLMWTSQEAYRFLKETPLFEQSGLLVRVPDWWRKRARARVAVTIGERKTNKLGLDAMLDFSVDLVVGDTRLTRAELKEIQSTAGEGLLLLKGQWVEVDRDRLNQALAHWKDVESEAAGGGITFIEGMRLLAGAPQDLSANDRDGEDERQWSYVNAGTWLEEILAGLRDPKSGAGSSLSKHFKGNLRPYQKAGHDWLHFLTSLGLGACLADDMGLGKTVQILALLLSIKESKKQPHRPSLLVLPASLIGNWQAEIARFAPTLKARFIHPSQTSPDQFAVISGSKDKLAEDADLVVTTYGMLLRQNWLSELPWRLVILDEAQAIKNPSAQQTKSVKKLQCEARIALTGTPVENRLSDLWSLFDFLLPGLLGSTAKFKSFIRSLDESENKGYAPLRKLVSPYILRRLKSDKSIITDLPDKTELKVYCGLSKQQAALYSASVEELARVLETVDGIKRRGLVLSYLLRFKQICNHPSQLLANGDYNPGDSGKFQRLRTIAEEIASRQEKMLVFTQYREMTEPLAQFLAEIFGRPGLLLHGGTAVAKRKNLVDTFQESDGPPFMVLTVKAGGTGLNLTAASHVVHFDRWWNPAVENQATDRAYRIGQHRNVLVHKFICSGTIEEKIDALIAEKTALADGILAGGAETLLTEMSDKELLSIVSLDLERVNIGEVL